MSDVNEYKLIREMKGGQFGRVFLVTRLEREYVLKHIVLGSEETEIIVREVYLNIIWQLEILETLHDRQVLHYYTHFIDESILQIITEFCPNGDLGKLIKHFAKNNRLIPKKV